VSASTLRGATYPAELPWPRRFQQTLSTGLPERRLGRAACWRAVDIEAVTTDLDKLPEREQHILALRFWGNLSQAEIGGRLGQLLDGVLGLLLAARPRTARSR